ncbi:hypothetical protein WH95_15940 [Kiloniella litopenaei]|uniref:Uncharacterized protein n=1 Tax=Kiloniella litopenaei TaxID=1549748 RepID=A0A0M2R8L2_9PROT|nr:hypothetical protein WH95_15940 [Kiloniella litopenaei]
MIGLSQKTIWTSLRLQLLLHHDHHNDRMKHKHGVGALAHHSLGILVKRLREAHHVTDADRGGNY